MRKTFILLALSALVLWSCDDGKNPEDGGKTDLGIIDVEIPAASEIFEKGDEVEIKGTGFLATDMVKGVWVSTRATATPPEPSFEVPVTLTPNGISFVLPVIKTAGKYSLTLYRNGEGTQALGVITLESAEISPINPYVLYGVGEDGGVYKLWGMKADGTGETLFTFDSSVTGVKGIIYEKSGGKLYGIVETTTMKEGYVYVDIAAKTVSTPVSFDNLHMFGLNESGVLTFLYSPTDNPDQWKLGVFSDAGEGKIDEQRNFGEIKDMKNAEIENSTFANHGSSGYAMFGFSVWNGGKTNGAQFAALGMNDGVVYETSPNSDYESIELFNVLSDVKGFFYSASAGTSVYAISMEKDAPEVGAKSEGSFQGRFRCPVWNNGQAYALKTDDTTEKSELYEFSADWVPTKVASMPDWVFEITAAR